MSKETCSECRFWIRGTRSAQFKTPPWCGRHSHSQDGDDPACKQYESAMEKEKI